MKRIVIIDDEPQIRDMLQKILQRYGYEVAVAENGKEGIKLCANKPADLVITDLTMPEKDGMETIKELRSDYPGVKIIAMSGGGDRFPEYFLDKAIESGAVTSLKKPFRKDDILKVVYEILGEGNILASGG